MNTLKSKYSFFISALFVLGLLSLNACKSDDDNPPPCDNCEEELITTLRLIFTAPDDERSTFSFRDVDGVGGDAPSIDTIRLAANTNYQLSLEVLDESKTPAEDIGVEIKAEDEDHLFLFTTSSSALTILPSDMDSNGKPVGLQNTATTGDAATGTIRVVLKHKADKDATDPSTTGETDIEATFNFIVG